MIQFIKGYYRLATAQSEMGAFSDAEVTINAALQIEPGQKISLNYLFFLVFN